MPWGRLVLNLNLNLMWQQLAVGFITAMLCGYVCIWGFFILLQRIGLMPFVFYRLILGFAVSDILYAVPLLISA